jgi:hypothetical protein
MKAASIHEIKQELLNTPVARVTELCLRLARFKKENKELLTFLLFEADDITAYIKNVKEEIDLLFEDINVSNVYFVKKTLRKILRNCNKYIRYSGSDVVETETLLHFCTLVKELGGNINKNTVISNIYQAQIKKINKSIAGMHEDLQYEYLRSLDILIE